MKDYRFIKEAPLAGFCSVRGCARPHRQGDPVYFELTDKRVFCVPCGRTIRASGGEVFAKMGRLFDAIG